jgi:hypothetical protein
MTAEGPVFIQKGRRAVGAELAGDGKGVFRDVQS